MTSRFIVTRVEDYTNEVVGWIQLEGEEWWTVYDVDREPLFNSTNKAEAWQWFAAWLSDTEYPIAK